MTRLGSPGVWVLVLAVFGCEDAPASPASDEPPTTAPQAQRPTSSQAFVELDGEGLRERVRRVQADAVLLNVWATWCEPCKHELPDLLRLGRDLKSRGLELMLVNADFPDQRADARAFLRKLGTSRLGYAKTGGDDAFIRALHPDWSGALPATFLFDAAGDVRRFWQEEISYERLRPILERWLRSGQKEKP